MSARKFNVALDFFVGARIARPQILIPARKFPIQRWDKFYGRDTYHGLTSKFTACRGRHALRNIARRWRRGRWQSSRKFKFALVIVQM